MITGLVAACDFGTGGEGAEGKSVCNALGGDQDVGLDALMLDREHLAGACESGLHLVGDEEDSVLVENFLDLAEVVLWRDQDASFAQYGFGNESGDVAGGGEAN